MLISHKYKFILLKTEKTASSSILTKLREIVRESDDPYPASRAIRRSLLRQHCTLDGFSFDSPGNKFKIGIGELGLNIAKPGGLKKAAPGLFGLHSHAKAKDIREFIGKDIFDSYTKITSERNPWDRQVSLFRHRANKKRKKFTVEYFNRCMCSKIYNSTHYNKVPNWDIYSIDDKVCVDHVIRFEHLNSDYNAVLVSLGIDPERYPLSKTRVRVDKNTGGYQELFTRESSELIRKWYRREIDYFGYKF